MPPPAPRSTCTTTKPTCRPLPTASTPPLTSSLPEDPAMPGLEDLYREIILDHYRNPRTRAEPPTPAAHRNEGFNPLCGDEVVVFLDVEDGVVKDLRIAGQ